jgi:hypothetical protein
MNETLSQLVSIVIAAQFIISFSYIRHLTQRLPGSNIPDFWFGYSTHDLNDIFELWGTKGRKYYVQVAKFDMMAFIPSYALMLGYIFYNFGLDVSTTIWWISIIAWCDYVETFVLMIQCAAYPHGDVMHMDTLVKISSYSNMAKWLLIVGLVIHGIDRGVEKRKKKKE